jgi:hypothetical protein
MFKMRCFFHPKEKYSKCYHVNGMCFHGNIATILFLLWGVIITLLCIINPFTVKSAIWRC